MTQVADQDRYRKAARLLHDVAKPMRVLSALGWDASIREQFLSGGAQKLPEPTYAPIDPSPVLDGVAAARRLLHAGHVVDDWLEREASAIESTARMLASLGTPAFHVHSRELYGAPRQPFRLDPATPLQLAEQIQGNLAELSNLRLLPRVVRSKSGEEVAAELRVAVAAHFGAGAPKILVVDELSANAVASTSRIKIRRDAQFTTKDAAQLLHHEAFIHVATGMNGREQTEIPILAIGHPGTARTQEGLAVYSEYVSGTLDLDRLRRLADRILAVQMVIDGADFIEIYRWFLDRGATPAQAFESSRRNFRGGVIKGGAPFTKDCSYLSGFLAISGFVRSAFMAGRADTLGLLFAGKLDIWSIPALGELRRQGMVKPARYLPPWALDPGWILSYLALNAFMATLDMSAVAKAIGDALESCPRVEIVSDRPGAP